jgi:hypothetical protein
MLMMLKIADRNAERSELPVMTSGRPTSSRELRR